MDKKSGSFIEKVYNVDRDMNSMAEHIENWWKSPRWENTRRLYSAKDIAALKSTYD